jgi:hypothetical protein
MTGLGHVIINPLDIPCEAILTSAHAAQMLTFRAERTRAIATRVTKGVDTAGIARLAVRP